MRKLYEEIRYVNNFWERLKLNEKGLELNQPVSQKNSWECTNLWQKLELRYFDKKNENEPKTCTLMCEGMLSLFSVFVHCLL